jgi:hypothetical protein
MPEEPQRPYEFGPTEITWRLPAFWFGLFCVSLAISSAVIHKLLQLAASLI